MKFMHKKAIAYCETPSLYETIIFFKMFSQILTQIFFVNYF